MAEELKFDSTQIMQSSLRPGLSPRNERPVSDVANYSSPLAQAQVSQATKVLTAEEAYKEFQKNFSTLKRLNSFKPDPANAKGVEVLSKCDNDFKAALSAHTSVKTIEPEVVKEEVENRRDYGVF
ncbi:hypothetical protein Lqui_2903 [Legionella quinlivanii]|uniref:Uncharacterized protein n=1 Tax=Legionella quinlivanii TaxID=45073 RepID=Q49J58_9GAMM|nr:hypothetical protein [Legionella quinlivanii]AAX56218.1 unknown [Legionella quinlivanii]KTD45432.1 hypothetical protein Lqui_2903 [Legionella quinlivanii]SEG33783.1 hypothetical protein SAMN02746093_02583 [Legionella quinlivanii DSM 21216]STY10523.1 Uncharacterised protein [Legionella quinlivanii]